MKTKQLLGMCIMFLLFASLARAVTVSEETSSVSRLVGKSPEDIINQLDSQSINLNHASYYGNYINENKDDLGTIGTLFPYEDAHYETGWWFNTINFNIFKPQELFIINAKGEVTNKTISSTSQRTGSKITPTNVASWVTDFMSNYPLFIFNSDYAGLAIPNKDSFIYELTRYSEIIAPTFHRSPSFTRALLCNLGDEKTLGHTFRTARNRYYQFADPSKAENLAITLMSYHLYGNPLAIVRTPEFDEEKLMRICGNLYGGPQNDDFQEIISTQSVSEPMFSLSYSIQGTSEPELNDEISRSITLNYDIEVEDNFDILFLTPGDVNLFHNEKVEPFVSFFEDLPRKAVVTNVDVTMTSPESLYLNIPLYDMNSDDLLIESECIEQSIPKSYSVVPILKEDRQTVAIYVNPLEMVSCDDNHYRLYRNINYKITFVTPSPLYFDNVTHPERILPNTNFNLEAYLRYVQDSSLNGTIELYQDDAIIYQQELFSKIDSLSIPVTSVDTEKITRYSLKYIEDDEILSISDFVVQTRILDTSLSLPDEIGNSAEVKLFVYNHLSTSEFLEIKDNLIKDYEKLQGDTKVVNLNPGLNEILFNYNNLKKSDISYDLHYDLLYNGRRRVLHGSLITNNPPQIYLNQSKYSVRAGNTLEIHYEVSDPDGDDVLIDITGPIGLDGVWETQPEDEGNYTFIISAYDGYEETRKHIYVTVEPYNRKPIFLTETEILSRELETVGLFVYAIDLDDDDITYSVEDSRFVQVNDNLFEWETEIGDEGNYTILVIAYDGYEESELLVNINVRRYIPPMSLSGRIVDVNGTYIEEDSTIEAYIDGILYFSSLTNQSYYEIEIQADDPDFEWKTGGNEGDVIDIYVDGILVENNIVWQEGVQETINLTLDKYFVTLDLEKGWNLISLPYQKFNPSLLTDKGVKHIYHFDGLWKTYVPELPFGLNTLRELNYSMGIWAYSDEVTQITFAGSRISSAEFELKEGWNMIGYPFEEPMPVEDFLGDNITLVSEQLGDGWNEWFRDYPQFSNLESMKPGRGYWVYSEVDKMVSVE